MMDEKFIHEDLFYALSNKDDGNLSCKWGEEKEVISNRIRFLEKNGLTIGDCIMTDLHQSDGVAIVDRNDLGKAMSLCKEEGIAADSLITNEAGVYLFLLTADCMPTVLYDPTNRVLALAHLGRQTTSLKLVQKTIKLMAEKWGTDPADLLVHGGPSIGKNSYRLDSFNENKNEWHDFIKQGEGGGFYVDVVGYNRRQLLDMRVKEDNIYTSSIDTFTSLEYYSHYRSVRTGEDEGRFATVVGMK